MGDFVVVPAQRTADNHTQSSRWCYCSFGASTVLAAWFKVTSPVNIVRILNGGLSASSHQATGNTHNSQELDKLELPVSVLVI